MKSGQQRCKILTSFTGQSAASLNALFTIPGVTADATMEGVSASSLLKVSFGPYCVQVESSSLFCVGLLDAAGYGAAGAGAARG